MCCCCPVKSCDMLLCVLLFFLLSFIVAVFQTLSPSSETNNHGWNHSPTLTIHPPLSPGGGAALAPSATFDDLTSRCCYYHNATIEKLDIFMTLTPEHNHSTHTLRESQWLQLCPIVLALRQ